MAEETGGIDPYDAVLADLRAKRDQIDQAITAIEGLRNGAAHARVVPPADTPPGGPKDGPGHLLGMSIVDATKKLLASKRTTLKNPDIAALFREGGLMLNSKDWTNTIGAVLTRRSVDVGDIVKVGRGIWGLKEWYPGRSFKKDKADNGDKGAADEAEETTGATT